MAAIRLSRAVLVAALCAVPALGTAVAGEETTRLLRGGYAPFCEPAMLCAHREPLVEPRAPAAIGTVFAAPRPLEDIPSRPILATDPAPAPLPQPSAWDVEAAASLRGSYVAEEGNERFELLAVPEIAALYRGSRTRAELRGSVDLMRPGSGDARVEGANVTASVRHALDSWSAVSANAGLRIVRDADAPGGTTAAPLEFIGTASGSFAHDFGKATGEVTGTLRRHVYEFAPAGGDSNSTGIGGALRLGYRITPILTPFVSGEVSRETFDLAPAGNSRDGWSYALRAGIAGDWSQVLTGEVSVGYGWRAFDEAGLPTQEDWLTAASLTYRPTATLELRAGYETLLLGRGPGAVSIASIEHRLRLDALYRVNSLLGLRASGTLSHEEFRGSGESVRRMGAGVGADYRLGPRSSLTADYEWRHRENRPAATGHEEHRVTLGITVRR